MDAASDEELTLSLAKAFEECPSVRERFRKQTTWLQFPIPALSVKPEPREGDEGNEEKKVVDPHAPSTRALELNVEILQAMLGVYGGEFVDIKFLKKEAGFGQNEVVYIGSFLVGKLCIHNCPLQSDQAALQAHALQARSRRGCAEWF